MLLPTTAAAAATTAAAADDRRRRPPCGPAMPCYDDNGSDWPPTTPHVKVPELPPFPTRTHRSTNHRRSRRPSHPNRRRRSSWRAR